MVEMQAEMIAGRFDPGDAGAVARFDLEEMLEPDEVVCPVGAGDTFNRIIGSLAVAAFVPGLKAQRRDAVFGSGQGLGGAQHGHPCRGQPDAGVAFIGCGIEGGDLADAGTTQRKAQRRAALAATEDGDVVVDVGPVGHPIGGVGADHAERGRGKGVGILCGHFETVPPFAGGG